MKSRGQQRFASKGSLAQKLIKRIVKLAKSSPIPEKKIAETLSELYEVDQNLSQSLIFAIENLIYSSKNITAARSLFLHTVALLSKNDKNQCFDFTYSCDPKAIDKESLEIVFELHLENEHYLASLILLDGLDQNESTQQKRKSIVQAMKNREEKKIDIIYQNLANLLLRKKSNEKLTSKKDKNSSKFLLHLLETPSVTWRYRSQLSRMIRRDLNTKYQKSILGWVWGIIEPLALTVTFLFLFDILSATTSRYMPLNIMIGIIIWSGFGQIMLRGTKSLESNTAILQRVKIPRQIFLLNITGTAIVTISLNILAIIPLLIYYQIVPTWKIILFPVSLILVAIYAVSVSLFTSTIQTKWRDVSHFVTVAIRIGFYFTPVFFTLEMLINGRIPPEFLTAYLILNPIAIYLSMARTAFTNESVDIGTEFYWISLLHLAILYCLSSYWFSKNENKAVKYL